VVAAVAVGDFARTGGLPAVAGRQTLFVDAVDGVDRRRLAVGLDFDRRLAVDDAGERRMEFRRHEMEIGRRNEGAERNTRVQRWHRNVEIPPLLCGVPAAGWGSASISRAARLVEGTSTPPSTSCGTKTAPSTITIWEPSGMVTMRSRPTTCTSLRSTPAGRVTVPSGPGMTFCAFSLTWNSPPLLITRSATERPPFASASVYWKTSRKLW